MIETGAMQRRGPQPFISPLLQPPLHKLFVPRPFLDTYPPTDYYKDGYTGPRTTAVTPYIAPLMREPEVEFHPTDSLAIRKQKNVTKDPFV